MTDQEQADCERVAAWFEKKPDKPWTGQALATIMGRRSDKGFWTWNYDSWIPCHDFLTSEFASAILRDAMLDANCAIELCRIGGLIVAKLRQRGDYKGQIFTGKDAMRAIFGAFLKFMEVNPR